MTGLERSAACVASATWRSSACSRASAVAIRSVPLAAFGSPPDSEPAPPSLAEGSPAFSVNTSWWTSARSSATCLAAAGPCTRFRPERNSDQVTFPSPLASSDLKKSTMSSALQLACPGRWRMPCSTSGIATRFVNSSMERPPSSSESVMWKAYWSVSTKSENRLSSSSFWPAELTELTFSVMTPVRSAIMAKAVMRVYAMKNKFIA
mmetsp:Transcript_83282/g.258584  ORF Transcript_83282/g.258584 Transcript_83282/m.258584 type:complete len:207 (+) Transcript_83282:102-722(+)